ncbi:cell division protein FtsL [Acetobacter sp.]|jgi:hypothetical protein|uniref:cell division protein FtsL n=1 Tax=Acetobacter sp. TaxID=440 RepID=UPI0025C111F2|nr:hypothetical protein [Acetobacter sp.]MCH4089826.1 hypothetical protein [Acetobacter sp.]MCI1298522.1 hypothetical protein [Acetobacter sp.]MCI1315087.1 hypothetical protein [Acetobacter sp.]
MFRPFTFFCALLAGSSGMYLYTKKHQTTVLDQQISRIVSDTQHIRQQTAVLQTQWALLNQPDRLNHLASRFDPTLKPMEPKQFVRMTDLKQHLPAVVSVHDVAVARADAPVAPPASPDTAESHVAATAVMASSNAPDHDHLHDVAVKPTASVVADAPVRKAPVVLAKAETPALPLHTHEARVTEVHTAGEARRLTSESPKPQMLALSDATPAVTRKVPHHATAPASTDALALALGEKPETTAVHHSARTVVADNSVIRHTASHDATDLSGVAPATHHTVTRVAISDTPHHTTALSPVTVAAWRPTAAPRYVEARATYSGSLLGRSAIGGGLPPPMPVSN